MGDMRDSIPDNIEGNRVFYAEFSADVADLADLAGVIIPDFDPSLVWGPCKWQSRDATSLPAKGDLALVIIDNRRNPWIVAWWPFT